MDKQKFNRKFSWALLGALIKMPYTEEAVETPRGWTERGAKRDPGIDLRIIRSVVVQVRFPERERHSSGGLLAPEVEFFVPSAGVGTRVRLPLGFRRGQIYPGPGADQQLTRLLYRCCRMCSTQFQPVFVEVGG